MPQSKHIAVVGAGSMGHGIAQLFAAKGHEVTLYDRSETILNAVMGKIESNLAFLSQHSLDRGKEIRSTIDRIKLSANLQEATTGARFVVETVDENLRIKQSFLEEMEAYCSPVTILATHTSTFRISEIAAKMKVKKRVVGTHFWYPPYLNPLVEVMGSQHTLQEVKGYVCNLLLSMDMRPVLINREVPGFLGHRLQQALRREALSIIDQGIAAPADVDEVIRTGISIRLSVLGLLGNENVDGFDPTAQPHGALESLLPSSLRLLQEAEPDDVSLVTKQEFSLRDKALIEKCRAKLVRQQIDWNRGKNRELHQK